MNVTFVNATPMRSGVFAAHMLSLLSRIDRSRHTVNLVMLRPENPFQPALELVNGEFVFFKRGAYRKVVAILRSSDLVVCRNYHPAFFALVVKALTRAKYRVHSDLRGAVPDEALSYRRFPLNYAMFAAAKVMERVILQSSTSISCVCEPFRDYVIARGANPAATRVVWNGADVARSRFDPAVRAAVRRKLGIEDHFVFVYSGSANMSGRFERMLELYKAVNDANPAARLLILTRSTRYFERLCREAGVSGVQMLRLAPENVPEHLMAADYAFLVRQLDAASRFSFPIKFAEYLAAGLKIVISRGVGICTQYVEDHAAGVVLDDTDGDAAQLRALTPVPLDEKQRLAALAAADLDKNALNDRLLAALGF